MMKQPPQKQHRKNFDNNVKKSNDKAQKYNEKNENSNGRHHHRRMAPSASNSNGHVDNANSMNYNNKLPIVLFLFGAVMVGMISYTRFHRSHQRHSIYQNDKFLEDSPLWLPVESTVYHHHHHHHHQQQQQHSHIVSNDNQTSSFIGDVNNNDNVDDNNAYTSHHDDDDDDNNNLSPLRWPTLLWGIPTVDSSSEKQRRVTLRETYLNYYKNKPNQTNRICALVDLFEHKIPKQECQLAYAFFMGSNPQGPKELMYPNQSFPITVPESNLTSHQSERDVVYLNIKENQMDGKMQTWFKYGQIVVDHYNLTFDYIAKADSDSLFFTPTFMKWVEETLPPNPVRVFGGIPFFDWFCAPGPKEDHPCPMPLSGGLYMSGELYFMSTDLARYITSPECNRKKLAISHEDVSLGNFVMSHPKKVHIANVPLNRVLREKDYTAGKKKLTQPFNNTLWAHGTGKKAYFKKVNNVRKVWNQFLEYYKQTSSVSASDQSKRVDEHRDTPSGLPKGWIPVRNEHYIYGRKDWDSSPVVIESHKLIFFSVPKAGCTVNKKLLRRLSNLADWYSTSPHDPSKNKLKFLHHYDLKTATKFMNSPEYKRIIMIRDPKERILSAYLSKATIRTKNNKRVYCCYEAGSCAETFYSYVQIQKYCSDPHALPYSDRIDTEFISKIDHVLHVENAEMEMKNLLESLNLWDPYGKTGWGVNKNQSIFAPGTFHNPGFVKKYIHAYYTPAVESIVESLYARDYNNSIFNLTNYKIASLQNFFNTSNYHHHYSVENVTKV